MAPEHQAMYIFWKSFRSPLFLTGKHSKSWIYYISFRTRTSTIINNEIAANAEETPPVHPLTTQKKFPPKKPQTKHFKVLGPKKLDTS